MKTKLRENNLEHPKGQLLGTATAIYLVLPALFFAFGWLRSPFAVITIIIIIVFIAVSTRDIYRVVGPLRLRFADRSIGDLSKTLIWLCLAYLLIGFWLALSGVGGFGFQNFDYNTNNALFKDLIIKKWPITMMINGIQTPVVYYLAYYLPSAAVGKLLGWNAANVFLYLWTFVGTALSFTWFWKLSRINIKQRAGRILGLVTMFCFAGGLDYIGYYVVRGKAFDIDLHIEFWAKFFQYSSNTTLIYWVPQHTIAAWLMTGIVVDSLYESYNLKYLGMVIAAGILWTPFGVIGVMPYLVLVLMSHWRKLFNRSSLVVGLPSIWLGSIYLLYILSNQFMFPKGFIWQLVANRLSLIRFLLYFWVLEFALLALLLLLLLWLGTRLWRSPRRNDASPFRWSWFTSLKRQFDIDARLFWMFLVCLSVLILLPLFKMGEYNDLVMRGAIPSLFIFWIFVTKVAMDTNIRVKLRLNLLYAFLLMIIMLGFFPAISEISRSIKNFHIGPPTFTSVSTTENLEKRDTIQRSGDKNSLFYRYVGK